MHSEAVIEQVWRCIWRLRSSEIGNLEGGGKEARRVLMRLYLLVSSLTTVGMWWGDLIFRLSWRAGWWRSILLGGTPEAAATFRGPFVIMTMKGRQTILGGCCTQWMLYLVLTQDHGMGIDRDDLTLCSAMMVQLWTRKRDGEWRWEQYGEYEQIWEIRGTTCLIGLRRPWIGVITSWIGRHTCHIGNSTLSRSQNSVKSQFLIMISHLISSLFCHRQPHHRLRTRSQVIALYLCIPWLWDDTEYSIHRVQQTPCTAYTEYCIHRVMHHPKINCLPYPASLSCLGGPCCTLFSTFPKWRINQWIESQLPWRLPPNLLAPDWLPPDRPPPSYPPILIDHIL